MSLTVPYLSALMAVLVFLPNRYDVPYGVEIGGWVLLPITFIVALSPWIAWVVSRLTAKGSGRIPAVVGIPFFGWFLLALASTLLSDGTGAPRGQGVVVLTVASLWTAPFWYLLAVRPARREILITVTVFLLIACLGGAVTLVTSLGRDGIRALVGDRLEEIASYTNPRGGLPLGASTVIGAFYLMAIPIAYSLASGKGIGLSRWFGWTTVGFCLLGGMATASRSSVALLILATLASAVAFGLPWARSRRIVWLGIGLAVLGVIGIGALKLSSRLSGYDASVEWRKRGAEVAIEAIEDKPYLGHGVEAVFKREEGTLDSALFSKKKHDAIVYNYRIAPREPHNLYLLLGAENGLVGLFFFLAFLSVIGWKIGRAGLSATDSKDRRLAIGFLIGFLGVLLHSLSGSDLVARPRLASLFWIYCGLGSSWGRIAVESLEGLPTTKIRPDKTETGT